MSWVEVMLAKGINGKFLQSGLFDRIYSKMIALKDEWFVCVKHRHRKNTNSYFDQIPSTGYCKKRRHFRCSVTFNNIITNSVFTSFFQFPGFVTDIVQLKNIILQYPLLNIPIEGQKNLHL